MSMLINKTSGKTISANFELCGDVFSQFLGLMFSSKERVRDNSLVFLFDEQKRWSLHMWFVFYPIDVIFLDENFCVVDLLKGFRPFAFYTSRKEAVYVIEAETGAIIHSRTKIGDVIQWR